MSVSIQTTSQRIAKFLKRCSTLLIGRRTALYLALFALPIASPIAAETPAPKPNILIILADDLGFSDLGSYGGEIQTPNIDQLASGGLRFTQAYNTARCWPSRASLLTGYYAQSVRRDTVTGAKRIKGPRGVRGFFGTRPIWAHALPEYITASGYRSFHSGKWHLDSRPLLSGFDHSYLNDNEGDYFTALNHEIEGEKQAPIPDDGKFYSTIDTADYAIEFLKQHAAEHPDQPFFGYVAFNAPHFPIQALPEDIEIYKNRYAVGWDAIRKERFKRLREMNILACDSLPPLEPMIFMKGSLSEEELRKQIGPGEVGRAVPWDSLNEIEKEFQASKMAVHAAMIHRMDIEIGRILKQIKKMDALENTIIFFVSDNGASSEQIIRGRGHDPESAVGSSTSYLGIGPGWSSAANTPFRMHKSWVHEGGIATPMIVNWPAGITARNELRTDPVHLIDLLPTVLELTGSEPIQMGGKAPQRPLPGISLVPEFAKNGSLQRDYLWWDHSGNRAIRIGDWKLVADHTSPWELYDLSSDRCETRNMAATLPDKVQALEHTWKEHAVEFNTMTLRPTAKQ